MNRMHQNTSVSHGKPVPLLALCLKENDSVPQGRCLKIASDYKCSSSKEGSDLVVRPITVDGLVAVMKPEIKRMCEYHEGSFIHVICLTPCPQTKLSICIFNPCLVVEGMLQEKNIILQPLFNCISLITEHTGGN